MRVFGHLLLLASLTALAVSVWWAPRLRAGGSGVDTASLVIPDPLARGHWGEEQGALGVALSGYGEALAADPGQADAAHGLLRVACRLSAVSLGHRGLSQPLFEAFELYLGSRDRTDPDGAHLGAALDEFVRLRSEHRWYVGRAALAMFLVGKGDSRGPPILEAMTKMGQLYRQWLPAVQRHLPAWDGLEPIVRGHLESNDRDARVYAAVTLMMYRRLYGVGESLWTEQREAIGRTLSKAYRSMTPNELDGTPSTPGGMTLLALALYGSPETQRLVERLKPIDHPYLARVVTLARLWAGVERFSTIDFENPRYRAWSMIEQEFFYRGALLHYARLVREGRLDEAKELFEGTIADALVNPADVVKIMARRGLAAVHPEQSADYHRQMVEAGAVQRVYGVFGVPGADRVAALLPALTAPDPGVSSLAAVGLLPPAETVPIQMPRPKE